MAFFGDIYPVFNFPYPLRAEKAHTEIGTTLIKVYEPQPEQPDMRTPLIRFKSKGAKHLLPTAEPATRHQPHLTRRYR